VIRISLLAAAALAAAAPLPAQTSAPAKEDKPPPAAAKPMKQAKAKPAAKGSIAVRLQACQDIDDGTKGRLDCYDAVIPPASEGTPNPHKPKSPKQQ